MNYDYLIEQFMEKYKKYSDAMKYYQKKGKHNRAGYYFGKMQVIINVIEHYENCKLISN
jgi:hypothetical protein